MTTTRPRALARAAATLTAVAWCASCGGDSLLRQSASITDSAGIRVVTNPPPEAVGTVFVLAAEPEVEIGVMDGEWEYQFFEVSGAFLLPDGRIVVANGGSSEVRIYSPEGAHLLSFGREGDGPGEFRSISSVWPLPGDSIGVWDSRLRRVSVFDASGRLGRSFDVRDMANVLFPSVIGAFPDGSLLAQRGGSYSTGENRTALERDTKVFYRLSPEGALQDSVGPVPGDESVIASTDRWVMRAEPAFGLHLRTVPSGDRLVLAATDEYALRYMEPDGTVAQIVRQERTPRPVTPEDLDRWREDILDEIDPGDEVFGIMETVWDAMPERETTPAFDRVVAGDAGHAWVEEYRMPWEDLEGEDLWNVFGSDGILLGTVRTPWDLEVLHVSARYVLGVVRDELEVERIRLYRYNWVGGGG